MSTCHVCGSRIHPLQSMLMLALYAGEIKHPAAFLFAHDKHIRCSPSRAQYVRQINPPVVDDRPQFDKRLKPKAQVDQWTEDFSNAYERLTRPDKGQILNLP